MKQWHRDILQVVTVLLLLSLSILYCSHYDYRTTWADDLKYCTGVAQGHWPAYKGRGVCKDLLKNKPKESLYGK